MDQSKSVIRQWSLVLRLLLAAAGVAYIAYTLTWRDHTVDGHVKPGILTMLRHADLGLLLLGLVLVAPMYPIQTTRWGVLMRCRGLEVTWGKAFRLLMVGCFFNYCMPGTTGGDVVKAYYAAKRTDRRAAAVMSVIFDRIAGMLGLLALAAMAGLFMLGDPLARTATGYIWLAAAVILAGSALYFSRRLREMLGVDALFNLLPEGGLLAKLHHAASAYGQHKAPVALAVVMSVPVHFLLIGSTAIAGRALGMTTPFGLLLVVLPVVFLAGSLPLTYQGLGVMEGLAITMMPHDSANQIVGMLLLTRIYQVFYSLLGAAFLLKGDIHMHPPLAPEPSSPSPES